MKAKSLQKNFKLLLLPLLILTVVGCNSGTGNSSNTAPGTNSYIGAGNTRSLANNISNQQTTETGFTWTTNSDGTGVAIVSYDATKGLNVVIPDTIDGKPVVEIAARAFMNKGLTNVVIPSSVTSIKEAAFAMNKIQAVTLPPKLTELERDIFYINELTSVIIPEGVTKIGIGAFNKNPGLTSVSIPDSVNHIANYAFLGNILAEVTIPNAKALVESIAFEPNVHKVFGNLIQSNLSVDEAKAKGFGWVLNGESVTITSYDNTKGFDVVIPSMIDGKKVTSIGKRAFYEKNLASVIIPETVVSIKSFAFAVNKIKDLTIPSGVREIEEGAFFGSGFENLIIKNGITKIAKLTFQNFRGSLIKVTIPKSVTSIEKYAFGIPLAKITIDNLRKNINIDKDAFFDAKTELKFSDKETMTSNGFTFNINDDQRSVTITSYDEKYGLDVKIPPTINGKAVTIIGYGAFYDKGLQSVTIPSGVTTIEYEAFAENRLQQISIPTNVTTLEQRAFFHNRILNHITIGRGVKTIFRSTFSDCWIISVTIYNKKENVMIEDDAWGANSSKVKPAFM